VTQQCQYLREVWYEDKWRTLLRVTCRCQSQRLCANCCGPSDGGTYLARRVKSGNNDHNGSPAIKRALQQAETPILSIHRHLRRLGRNAIQVTLRFSLALETPNWRCAFACWHTHHTAASYGPLLSARLRFAEAVAPRPAGACRQTKACLLRSGPPLLGQAGMHSLTLRLSKKFPQVQVMQSVVPVADRHRRGINPSHRLCTPDSLVGCVGDDPLE
jgi:hypothetical protein